MDDYNLDAQQLKKKESTVNGLGIAGLITGIITLFIGFIPCIGVLAMVLGVVSLTLSIIGLVMASKYQFSKGMLIAALITAGLGCILSITQLVAFGGVSKTMYDDIQENMERQKDGSYEFEYKYESNEVDSLESEQESESESDYEQDSIN